MLKTILDTGHDQPILDSLLCSNPSTTTVELIVLTSDAHRYEQLIARFGFYSSVQITYSKELPTPQKDSPTNLILTPKSDSFLIVSAANDSFRWWYNQLAYSAAQFNYPLEIYDLGGLGFGKSYESKVHLNENGYYTIIDQKWKSKALHKPDIIADCLNNHPIQTVYLDADTYIYQPISEIFSPSLGDYDIGITVRSAREIEKNAAKDNQKYTGYINAGVVFFRNTPGAKIFVKQWQEMTLTLNNDQMALNQLVNPNNETLMANQTKLTSDYKIRFFDGASN